jgi:hypothetical protein
MSSTSQVSLKTFKRSFTVAPFQVEGIDRVFHVRTQVPAFTFQAVMDHATAAASMADYTDKALEYAKIIELAMDEDEYAVLHEHMHNPVDPVALETLVDIVYWLLELYGVFPTTQPSSSSAGSQDNTSGTSSEDGASLEESVNPSLST